LATFLKLVLEDEKWAIVVFGSTTMLLNMDANVAL